MEYSFYDFLKLLGSLALFLYGMKIMSEGLQKFAGDRLRKILTAMTTNRVTGVLTGVLVTALIQSSSATTVMVVSFVNAGLLTLSQSIGVIMGANIGTTVTAWIISALGFKVDIAAFALPLLAFGIPLLFSQKSHRKSIGEFIFGFSFLFMGLSMLQSNAPDLKANPEMLAFVQSYTDMGYISILLFVFIGTILTMIVQASAATMAITLIMCANGWISFELGAALVLGENIGTTITSQLVSFNLSKIAPLILLVGVVVMMFTKKEKVRKVAEVVVGFGILFVGLSTMSQAMANMKNEPQVVNLLMSLKNPFLATLMGFALTAIIQSSSVTVSIVLLLANQDLLPLPITLYIILGCNIGACATAMLASMTGKKDAKRAALIHLLFNIIGTVIIYIALFVAGNQIVELIKSISADNGRFVANAHTLIKIAQVIMLFPFTGWLVKMTYLIVPGEDQKVGYRESYQLKYIGDKVVFNPATAVVEVVKELERMASLAEENLNRAMNALITLDEEDIEEVYEVEKNINFLNHAITDYLVKINQTTLPIEDLNSLGALFHVVNDIERIGDHAENVADAARQRKEEGVSISKEAQKELGDMLEMVNKIIRYAVEMFAKSDETHMQEIITLEDQVDEKERELQKKHVERLTKGECSPEAGMIFSDIVSGLERVADHATNIAFAITTEEEMDEGKTN